jgi:signal peptidase I
MTSNRSDLVVTPYRGASMEPTLKSGDLILWRRHEPSRPVRVGDVVGYFVRSRLVSHRVVLLDDEHEVLVTRGDGNLFADPPVTSDAVCYVAVAAWRGGRLVGLGFRRRLPGLARPVLRELRRVAGAGLRRLAF